MIVKALKFFTMPGFMIPMIFIINIPIIKVDMPNIK